jgi:hypothetical protein
MVIKGECYPQDLPERILASGIVTAAASNFITAVFIFFCEKEREHSRNVRGNKSLKGMKYSSPDGFAIFLKPG